MISKNNTKIYNKRCFLPDNETKSLIVKTISKLPCKFHIVEKILKDYDFRGNFESLFKNKPQIIKELISNEEKIKKTIEYFYLKMPFIFSDRDFVVQRKTWLDYNGNKDHALFHVHSIENPQYPEKDKPVRGTYINRSGYVKPLGDNQCKIDVCTCMDVKMSLGVSTMSKSGAEKQEKWVKGLKKACSN